MYDKYCVYKETFQFLSFKQIFNEQTTNSW